ncbi:LysM repeat protein [Flavobacterium arsenatis]|uniref:LysM repeat protein n=1 Tax=Flavobacterium arsenatis TaxID=1484332 RepID=A0ABU1TQS2_9FLAO|nr:GDSL-type esterase/lipase family protein [Flavobacterium arsenatis]MDR6968246.1 LysM repeat protein [Flavobacterium arsenatis]
MQINRIYIFFWLLFAYVSQGQTIDSSYVEIDSVSIDTIEVDIPNNGIINSNAIRKFYQKLANLEGDTTSQKVNIVHIGDSHIQADLMTNVVREKLQDTFGNGGRGLIFPHNLARTNGSWDVKFSSNESWNNHRIVSPVNGSNVGLSGILLSSRNDDFAIEVNAKEADNFFNLIKIVTPNNENMFQVATAKKTIVLESDVPKSITHKIKNGEALSIIADKYNVSVSEIKRANGLKSNNIRAGKTLKIPTNQMQKRSISRSEFIPLEMMADDNSHFYRSEETLEKIYLIPNKEQKQFELNGVVLENDKSGILYHNIGVNGAKLSDYNKYPMFFEQLKSLQPDLIVVSLGTNESFDHMKSQDYMQQLDVFIQSVKAQNPNAEILVATPPPSLFKRKYPNTFCADYAQKTIEKAEESNYAVWDMYSQLGGLYGVAKNAKKGLIGSDRVHYTKAGYVKQGELLAEALLNAFQNYKITKE